MDGIEHVSVDLGDLIDLEKKEKVKITSPTVRSPKKKIKPSVPVRKLSTSPKLTNNQTLTSSHTSRDTSSTTENPTRTLTSGITANTTSTNGEVTILKENREKHILNLIVNTSATSPKIKKEVFSCILFILYIYTHIYIYIYIYI